MRLIAAWCCKGVSFFEVAEPIKSGFDPIGESLIIFVEATAAFAYEFEVFGESGVFGMA